MEPAGGMTEVFRKNKRGVAAQHTRRINHVRISRCKYEYNFEFL